MTDPLLSLPDAVSAIDARRRTQQPGEGGHGQIPRRVMQYWDREPPPQVTQLIERSRVVCGRHGAEHVLFDDARARQLLAAHYPGVVLAAYDAAEHPAMKCDVFRLAWLHHTGGHYVDADIVLRGTCAPLFDHPGEVLVFQWDTKDLTNLCNWLIASRPGHPAVHAALLATAHSVVSHCTDDPKGALKNILGVSGPGIFTRGIGSWLASAGDSPEAAGVRVLPVSFAHRMIQLGPQYLKAPLNYKADERHWLAAAGDAAAARTAPAAPAAPAPAPATWWQRLTGRKG